MLDELQIGTIVACGVNAEQNSRERIGITKKEFKNRKNSQIREVVS